MYLLDTNVLSEFMRPRPSVEVVAWLDAQSQSSLFVSSISQAEILLGIALLDQGRRKNALTHAALGMFDEDFAGRCLGFDHRAAKHYANVITQRRQQGLATSVEDAQIAAIALAHDLTLVTRNTKDFENILGLQQINPWKS